MDQALRTFLKRRGNKEHVVKELVKQVERFEVYVGEEQGKGLAAAGVALALLGERMFDVYLNEVALWQNVPVNVWQ